MAVDRIRVLSRTSSALFAAVVCFLGGWSSPLAAREAAAMVPIAMTSAAASSWMGAALPVSSSRTAVREALRKSGIEVPLGTPDAATDDAAERLERIAMLTRFLRPGGPVTATGKRVGDVDALAIGADIVAELQALAGYESAVETHWRAEADSMARIGVPGQVVSRQAQLMADFRQQAAEFRRLSGAVERAVSGRGQVAAEQAVMALAEWFAQQQNLKVFDPIALERMPLQFVGADRTPAPEEGSPAAKASAKTLAGPVPADLAPTTEVVLTPEIEALAAELGNEPVAIRNWVYNNIEFDPTFGSIQGAGLTLLNRHGNAVDIASLTIALLRASGIPARYVQGNIELPVEQVQNWLGNLSTPAMAADLLQKGGVPTTALVSGGQIRAVRMTHVWVEAWVDFQPSRGGVNRVPDQWLPLDAAFKQFEYLPALPWREVTDPGFEQAAVEFAQGVQIDAAGGLSGFDFDALDAAVQELARSSAENLAAQHPGATAEDLRDRRTIVPVERLLLEGSLPYPVVSAAPARYSAVPAAGRHLLRVAFYADETSLRYDSPSQMVDIPLARIGTKRLWVDYAPASDADAQAMAQYAAANAETMPIGQIHVRTLLKLGDEVLFDGGVAQMGTLHIWSADLRDAHGAWTRTEPYRFAAGSQILFQPNLAGITPERAERETAGMPESARLPVRDFLYYSGLTYWMLHDRIDEDAARFAGGRALRLPSIGTFSAPLQVRYFFGIPRTGSYKGYSTDVKAVRTAITLPNPGDAFAVALQLGAGGSLAESVSWNLVTGTPLTNPGVSSAAAIRTAIGEGQRLFQIDASNVGTALAELQLSADAENEIRAAAQAGLIVVAHERELENRGWRGSGYVIIDPVSGGSMQRLEGGLAGGINMGCLAQAVLLEVLCNLKIARKAMALLAGLAARAASAALATSLMTALLGPAALAIGPVVAMVMVAVSYAMAAYEVYMWVQMIMSGIETLTSEDLAELGVEDLNEVLCSYTSSCFDFLGPFLGGGGGGDDGGDGEGNDGEGGGGPNIGNPTQVGTGAKWQVEADYVGTGPFPLHFVRSYSSAIPKPGSYIGNKWSASNFARLRLPPSGSEPFPVTDIPDKVLLVRPDGGWFQFNWRSDRYVGESNIPGTLERLTSGGATSGWLYRNMQDHLERFGPHGRLESITHRSGIVHALAYDDDGRLESITDSFGRSLRLAYHPESGLLATLTDPADRVTQYRQDDAGNLVRVTYPDGRSRQYHYEDLARPSHLTGITDERGVRLATYRYNIDGKVAESTRAGGADRHTFRYGRLTTTVTDPLGTERSYHFVKRNDRPYLSHLTEPCGSCGSGGTAVTRYDSRGYVAERQDFRGNLTRFVRNARGLVESRTDAVGTPEQRTTTYTWHPELRRIATKREPVQGGVRITTFAYDDLGNRKSTTITVGSESRTWTYGYNVAGQVESIDGPRTDVADVVRYEYEPSTGNLQRMVDANGLATRYTSYDANGLLLEEIDPNGLLTGYEYDLRDRLRFVRVGPEGSSVREVTEYRYDPAGKLERVLLPDGSFLAYGYDAAGRLESIEDALGNRIAYTLNANGDREAEYNLDPDGNVVKTLRRTIDALGRMEAVAGASPDEATRYGYDENGNERYVYGPLHAQPLEQQYDALDRLKLAIDPMGGQVRYTYDAQDNLRQVADPRGLATDYTYNGFDELIALDSPDTGITTMRYDPAGNLVERIDARSSRASYRYDAGNRLRGIDYADETIVLEYDDVATGGAGARGRLISAAVSPIGDDLAPGNSARYAFDTQGRVTGKSQNVSGQDPLELEYGYDPLGRLERQVLPSGAVIGYGYGADGRVLRITVNGVEIVREIEHFPFGGVAGWRYGPDQAPYLREFDPDGRITAHTLGGTTRHVEFDAADRVVSISDEEAGAWSNWTFGYDDLNRLTNADNAATDGPTAGLGLGWGFDATGNRISQERVLAGAVESTVYTIAADSNRLDQVANGPLVDERQYDAVGNTVQARSTDGTYAGAVLDPTYSARNRLVGIRTGGVPIARYAYNAFGERIAKWTGGAAGSIGTAPSVQFVYDEDGHLLGEYDGAGALRMEHVWIGDTPVAAILPASSGQGGFAIPGTVDSPAVDVAFVHPDHLDTPRVIVNVVGDVVWRWESAPYGDTAAVEQPDPAYPSIAYNLRLPGQYRDLESGMHHNYFRDYEPASARFVQSDPEGLEGGAATYSYVGSDPLAFVDVEGEKRSRRGRSDAIRNIEDDPKQPRCVRGWLKNERRHAAQGGRPSVSRGGVWRPGGNRYIRLPPGYDLAHPQDAPSCSGCGYGETVLQNEQVHDIQTGVQRRRGRF